MGSRGEAVSAAAMLADEQRKAERTVRCRCSEFPQLHYLDGHVSFSCTCGASSQPDADLGQAIYHWNHQVRRGE